MGFLDMLIVVAVVLGLVEFSYSGKLYLSSSPTNGSYCPGTILFTCTGLDIPIAFNWLVNGSTAGSHIYNMNDKYPVTISPGVPLPASVAIVVLSASSGGILQNVTTVLMGDMSDLIGSTIQCESQQFRSEVFIVEAQVPTAPTIVSVYPTYDTFTSFLSRVDVQWSVLASECSQVTYRVTLEDTSGGMEDQQMKICRNGTFCTTFFTPSPSNQTYRVRIIATNDFGGSSPSTPLSQPIAGLTTVNHSITFESCSTTVLCYSPEDEGKCSIRYGLNSYNQDPTISGSLNTNFTLPLMKPNTLYHYQINVTGNYTVQFQSNFTTAEFDVRWTSANIVLSVVGALLLTASLLFGLFAILICYLKQVKRGSEKQNPSTNCPSHVTSCHHCHLVFTAVCAGAILAFISLALWIAAWIIVDKEENTCDPAWKSDRDGLIIAAMIISLFAFLLMVLVPAAIAIFNIVCLKSFQADTCAQISITLEPDPVQYHRGVQEGTTEAMIRHGVDSMYSGMYRKRPSSSTSHDALLTAKVCHLDSPVDVYP